MVDDGRILRGEVKRIWDSSTGFIFEKLEKLKEGLWVWDKSIKVNRSVLKRKLNEKMKKLM